MLPSSKILQLITPSILDNRRNVLRLMRWRIANQQYYASQPVITEESFRTWLKKHVFGKLRLLFWVVDTKSKPIGHMGLYRFKDDSCEIDNVLRGIRSNKGRMGKALRFLVQWTLDNLPVSRIYLRVLSDNAHAIGFYQHNGFIPVRKVIVKRGSPLRFLRMKYDH